MVNLSGKTPDQIAHALRNHSRSELIDVIHSLVTVEQLLKPRQVALLEHRDVRDVIKDMKAGVYNGGYYAFSFNSLRVSASAVNARRSRQFVAAIATDKKEANCPDTGFVKENIRAKGRSARIAGGNGK